MTRRRRATQGEKVNPELGKDEYNPLPTPPHNSMTQLQAWQEGRVVKHGIDGVWAYTNGYRQFVACYFDRDSETESDPEQAKELWRDYRRETRRESEERKARKRFESITGYFLQRTIHIEGCLEMLGRSDDCEQRQIYKAIATEWQTIHDDPNTSRRAENKWLDALEIKMYDYEEEARNVANKLFGEVRRKRRKIEEINRAVQEALDRNENEDE